MKAVKTAGLYAALAIATCAALLFAGLMFAVATAPPAHAMESRVATPAVSQPVPPADVIAWNEWLNGAPAKPDGTPAQPNLMNAIVTKGGIGKPYYREFMAAVNTANGAIAQQNNPQFQTESAAAKGWAAKVCEQIGGC